MRDEQVARADDPVVVQEQVQIEGPGPPVRCREPGPGPLRFPTAFPAESGGPGWFPGGRRRSGTTAGQAGRADPFGLVQARNRTDSIPGTARRAATALAMVARRSPRLDPIPIMRSPSSPVGAPPSRTWARRQPVQPVLALSGGLADIVSSAGPLGDIPVPRIMPAVACEFRSQDHGAHMHTKASLFTSVAGGLPRTARCARVMTRALCLFLAAGLTLGSDCFAPPDNNDDGGDTTPPATTEVTIQTHLGRWWSSSSPTAPRPSQFTRGGRQHTTTQDLPRATRSPSAARTRRRWRRQIARWGRSNIAEDHAPRQPFGPPARATEFVITREKPGLDFTLAHDKQPWT